MTHENGLEIGFRNTVVEEVLQTYQQRLRSAEEEAGRMIREGVGSFLSAHNGNLPTELILCEGGDIRLDTRTCQIINISAQRPQPLPDNTWFVLRDRIAIVMEQLTAQPI